MSLSVIGLSVLFILSVASLFTVAEIVRKGLEIKRTRRLITPPDRIDHLERLRDVASLPAIRRDSPLRNLIDRAEQLRREIHAHGEASKLPSVGLRPADMDSLRISLEREIDAVAQWMERRLPHLEIVATTAPLLGLLGTVSGVMMTFVGITNAGQSSLAAVAPGVSEALITTVVGLIVAIPAQIAWTHYQGQIDDAVRQMEQFGADLTSVLAREMRG